MFTLFFYENNLQDGMDNDPAIMQRNMRSVSVDLTDNSLKVDISDALSEKDKVKFTVHTKVRFFNILIVICKLSNFEQNFSNFFFCVLKRFIYKKLLKVITTNYV